MADRFRIAVDLWDTGILLRRQAIRRAHPDATEVDVQRQLNDWLQQRPGAEHGDGPQPDRTP